MTFLFPIRADIGIEKNISTIGETVAEIFIDEEGEGRLVVSIGSGKDMIYKLTRVVSDRDREGGIGGA
jgi:hypothetical protein